MSDDLLTSIKQLNYKSKTSLYLAYAQFEIAATSYKSNMDKFLQSERNIVLSCDDSLDNMILIHGLILDQANLPFEISEFLMDNRQLWLLINETAESIVMDPYSSIPHVVKAIENYLDSRSELDISDFAIILGEEIPIGLIVSKAGTHIQASRIYE